MSAQDYDETGSGSCVCCEEQPATHRDDDVGPVCAECSAYLAVANARLITTPGINHCAEGSRR